MKIAKGDILLISLNYLFFTWLVWVLLLGFISPLMLVAIIDDPSLTITQLLGTIFFYGLVAAIYMLGLVGLFGLLKLARFLGSYTHLGPLALMLLATLALSVEVFIAIDFVNFILSPAAWAFASSILFAFFWFGFHLEKFLLKKAIDFLVRRKFLKPTHFLIKQVS